MTRRLQPQRALASMPDAAPLRLLRVGLACVAIVGQRVLAMIGPEFARGWLRLILLAVVQLVTAAFGPTAQLLTVGNQQDRCVLALSCGLVVLAGLNVILVPRFGLDGASLAVVLATGFWSTWLCTT
jgi:O-antigen/teichoic acid export membrane protein